MQQKERLHVFAYDIAEASRRNRTVEVLLNFGKRVGLSLFECAVDDGQARAIWDQLTAIIDPQTDRVNLYRACHYCERLRAFIGKPL